MRRGETPLLFVSRKGHRLHGNQLSKLVRDYLRGAGIAKPGAAHLLRYTTATLMLDAGADVRDIQALLGHSKLSTTAIYYVQLHIRSTRTYRSRSCARCTSARIRPVCSACPTRRHLERPTPRTRTTTTSSGYRWREPPHRAAVLTCGTAYYVGRAALPGERKSLCLLSPAAVTIRANSLTCEHASRAVRERCRRCGALAVTTQKALEIPLGAGMCREPHHGN